MSAAWKTNPVRGANARLALLVALLLLPAIVLAAAEEPPKKTLFLPKSATAAMYVLNRLSNRELIEAPRSEFVYVALLQRNGLERKYRVEALEGLAKVRTTDPLTELIRGIGELDRKGEEAEPALRDLATLLVQHKAAELSAKRGELDKLASEAQSALTRQIGYAALITADGSADKAWQHAESDAAKLADLLLSIPLLRDASLRAALHPKVEPLLHKADPPGVRRAAITAIAAAPGHDAETFNTLAALVKSGTERTAAVASLQRIPRKSWPKDQAGPLLESLVAHLQSVPVDQRTAPDTVAAFQFATDLATLLPPEKAREIGKTLRAIGVSVFVIRTVPEQMLYDKTLIVVEAGKPVEIILINDDAMPHNLVVVLPGAVEEIGTAAEKLPPEPDAQGRLYVPESPKVLHATRLTDAGQQTKLSFTAPTEPGDYQYVCTFPGHWRRMVGTLAVVKDVEAYLATARRRRSQRSPNGKWTIWRPISPRSPRAETWRAARTSSSSRAPSATSSARKATTTARTDRRSPRYKNDRADMLRQISSRRWSSPTVTRTSSLKDGESVTGMIVKEDADTATVRAAHPTH